MSWLLTVRKSKNKTQQEVADLAGITRPAYTNIETGRRRPMPETAKKIAAALGFEWTKFYE